MPSHISANASLACIRLQWWLQKKGGLVALRTAVWQCRSMYQAECNHVHKALHATYAHQAIQWIRQLRVCNLDPNLPTAWPHPSGSHDTAQCSYVSLLNALHHSALHAPLLLHCQVPH
jgi:hypothetical protein